VFTFLFKNRNNNKNATLEVDPGMVIRSNTPNVRDLIMNGNFGNDKDRSPLWKNYDDRNLTHPNMVS
jgi:hypothetical protein